MNAAVRQVYARAVAAGMQPHAADSFARAVAARTGLSEPVVEAWQQAEGGPADNPLNVRPGTHYSDPVRATVDFLTSEDKAGYYRGILGATSPAGEVAAIKASPFDAGHYGNGVLDRTAAAHGVGTGGGGVPAGHVEIPATSPPLAMSPDMLQQARGQLAQTLIGNLHAHGGSLDLVGLAGAIANVRDSSAPAATPAPAADVPAGATSAPVRTSSSSRALKLVTLPDTITTRAGLEVDKAIAPTVAGIVKAFGVRANSGYRSAEHNASVGGADNSDHLRGDAVDFTGSVADMRALYTWAQGRFPYVEPWDQAGGNHVHISFRR